MGCARGLCALEKVFIFINVVFAMFSGALLATAARLAWDPSTYTWFRFMCAEQYRASAAYVLAAGLWLAALVAVAAFCAVPVPAVAAKHRRRYATCLHVYAGGVVLLALSEVGYATWMALTLRVWWREAPQAELARKGADLLHDLKPALLAMERYKDVAKPLYDMIEEVEREAPNNAFVIIVFGIVGAVLQVVAFVLARRLARRGRRDADDGGPLDKGKAEGGVVCATGAVDDDSDDASAAPTHAHAHAPGWRKSANLRMYTILDKIF